MFEVLSVSHMLCCLRPAGVYIYQHVDRNKFAVIYIFLKYIYTVREMAWEEEEYKMFYEQYSI